MTYSTIHLARYVHRLQHRGACGRLPAVSPAVMVGFQSCCLSAQIFSGRRLSITTQQPFFSSWGVALSSEQKFKPRMIPWARPLGNPRPAEQFYLFCFTPSYHGFSEDQHGYEERGTPVASERTLNSWYLSGSTEGLRRCENRFRELPWGFDSDWQISIGLTS